MIDHCFRMQEMLRA